MLHPIAGVKRDEIESVLILGSRGLIRPQDSNPTITTTFDCQTAVPLHDFAGARSGGRKSVRQASTPVERVLLMIEEIDVEIKDDTRRANSLRVFDLRALLALHPKLTRRSPLRR